MSDLISIGASAVQLYRQSLSTVSNNIANLNTQGYSRQEAIAADNTPTPTGTTHIGNGARLVAVKRSYDEFVEANVRQSRSLLSAQQPLIDYTNRVIDIVGSDSTGLTPALDHFFKTANQLALEPTSITLRNSLFSAGESLATRIRSLAGDVDNVLQDSSREIAGKVSELNNLSTQIADVNRQLARQTSVDRQPPNLLDQRDHLLHRLSELASLQITELANGEVGVKLNTTAKDAWLVNRGTATLVSVQISPADPTSQLFTLDAYGTPRVLPGISGGVIGGLTDFREQVMDPLRASLDHFAGQFVSAINAVHRGGINLQNGVGVDLFRIDTDFRAFTPDGMETGVIQVKATGANPSPPNLEVTLLAGNTWRIREPATGKETQLEVGPGSHYGFEYEGLQLDFTAQPVPGGRFTISAVNGVAAGVRLAISEASAIAVAGRLAVDQPDTNSRRYQLEFGYGERPGPCALASGLPGHLCGAQSDGSSRAQQCHPGGHRTCRHERIWLELPAAGGF